jgi:hypothetical protein
VKEGVMNEITKLIQKRQSDRVPFDEAHKVSEHDLEQILEAGRLACKTSKP